MVETTVKTVHIKDMKKKELRKVIQATMKGQLILLNEKKELMAQRNRFKKENDELHMIINDLSSVLEAHKIV